MRLRKVENFPVRCKIFEVDYGFKGHLQDKPMLEIMETMDCVKLAQVCEVVLLIDPNGIHKNIILEISSY